MVAMLYFLFFANSSSDISIVNKNDPHWHTLEVTRPRDGWAGLGQLAAVMDPL